MRKIFQGIGLLALICFSFFYTHKITLVIKENDDIMKQIDEVIKQYQDEAIDAYIENDTIIPGLKGSAIDKDQSYKKMKNAGSFNTNLLVYKETMPKITLKGNYDKYIVSGNKQKKQVSLMFLVDNSDDINSVINILDKYNIKATFFIDGYWFENNNQQVMDLITMGHIVGNLGYNRNYEANGVAWMNTIITKIAKQDNTYCYSEITNETTLKRCTLNHSYTIKPSVVAKETPFITIRENVGNGSLISLDVNETTNKELPLIIEYINSKDLEIVALNTLLEE